MLNFKHIEVWQSGIKSQKNGEKGHNFSVENEPLTDKKKQKLGDEGKYLLFNPSGRFP